MEGIFCGLSVFFTLGLFFAIQFTLDAVVRSLRELHYQDWLKEGEPLPIFKLDLTSRLFGEVARLNLHRRLLFNLPDWSKRSQRMWQLVVQFRALHVGFVAYIILGVLFNFLLRFLNPTP